ncbi:unnamed protein product [Adineta steineri]|uniref:Peptidase M14 domain-containing protein n=2 Tax=Adineta steineri TaxID=433720 RepID=A0A815LFG0_9BILA|nr:unnamed protein product [Adineta steineri]
MALSASSPNAHVLLRPEVKYIANMHGNEVVGKEMLLYLIEYLLTSNDTLVNQLMNQSRIWIMPCMNPDGLEISQYGDCTSTNGRYTVNNIDLNRNFPDYYGATLDSSIQAQETSAVIAWLANISFVLSANYHGGSFTMNTPFDRYCKIFFLINIYNNYIVFFCSPLPQDVQGVSISDDDDIFQTLAHAYVNRTVQTNENCLSDYQNDGFVTRGADWYEITGGMQDYGYLNYGIIELTMEISCCKYPVNNTLPAYWNYNRDAMIQYLLQAQRGVKGLILNEYNQSIPSTEVMIDNRWPTVKVTSLGEFWRILLPGKYTLKVLYRSNEIYNRTIIIQYSSSPLNLTIIIPSSIYLPYKNVSTQGQSLFSGNIVHSSSFSLIVFFDRRLELAGLDLWRMARIDNVFVYPSEINIDRFKEALSRALSLWPFITGRSRLDTNEQYFIEMSDNPIPVVLFNDYDSVKWPFDSNVIRDFYTNSLSTYLDEVRVTNLFDNTNDEPLVRLKLTHIIQSNEWILGISWAHELGDAASCLNFSNTLSRLYQHMEPLEPLPIFERRLWKNNEIDSSLLSTMKHFRDTKPLEEMWKKFMIDQEAYDQVNLSFSGEQLVKLRTLAGEDNITIQDALTAYIILTLNKYCYYNDDTRRILRTNTSVNFRGVSDSIASPGQIGNAVFMMLSDDFKDPYSLSSIAKTIRQSIIKSRDSKFLERWSATADDAMRQMIHNNRLADLGFVPNDIIVNSNFRYDWADLVDFGYKDKCRFYTGWSGAFYLRVFRLNPICKGKTWLSRDRNCAEVIFRIEKDLKAKFLNMIKRDIGENFKNINK